MRLTTVSRGAGFALQPADRLIGSRVFQVWGGPHFANYHAELRDMKRHFSENNRISSKFGDVMNPDTMELLERTKELRVASEELMAKTHLLDGDRWLVMEGAKLLYDSPVCVTLLHETACPMPPFEERVQQLRKQIVACKTEAEAVELVQQLNALLHDALEELRGNEAAKRQANPMGLGGISIAKYYRSLVKHYHFLVGHCPR